MFGHLFPAGMAASPSKDLTGLVPAQMSRRCWRRHLTIDPAHPKT